MIRGQIASSLPPCDMHAQDRAQITYSTSLSNNIDNICPWEYIDSMHLVGDEVRHVSNTPRTRLPNHTHTHTHTWSIDKQYYLITSDSVKILRALKVGGELTSANVDPIDTRGQSETVEQQQRGEQEQRCSGWWLAHCLKKVARDWDDMEWICCYSDNVGDICNNKKVFVYLKASVHGREGGRL